MDTKKQPSSSVVQEAVFTVNENWQITSFNEAAEKLMGLTAQETIGKSCQSQTARNQPFSW